MPLAGAPGAAPTLSESIVPLLHAGWHPAGVAVAELVTLPGQVLISLLLVLLAARKLRAPNWPAVWLVAVAVELVFRYALTRPPVYRQGVHLVGLDMSWPSGHALRCSLVAAALAAAWPRLRIPLGIWLVAAVVLLELAGFHTVTDVVGGLLLAAVAFAGERELERSGLLRRASP
jgi:membrane-associated phospholipid phosphatase